MNTFRKINWAQIDPLLFTGSTIDECRTAALTYFESEFRFEGLTGNLKVLNDPVVEYWFKNGVADSDFIQKPTAGTTEGDMLYWDNSIKEWVIPTSGITWNETLTQLNLTGIQFDTTYVPAAHNEGLMHWNDDAGTLELGMKGGGIKLKLGLEQLFRAKNTSGRVIPNGTPIYLSGASGGNPTIGIANATNHIVANSTLGVAREDIPNNNFGYCVSQGRVSEVDTSSFIEGRPVFLDAISGLTQTLPTAPISKVFIGIIGRSHAEEGQIFVKILGRPNVEELSNVDINTDVTTGDVLTYNNGVWINSGFTAGSGVDLLVDDNTGLGITTGVTTDTIFTIYNTLLDPLLEVPTSVGGIEAGTTVEQLTGKTVVGLWNDLLFPTVLPTYTIPSIIMTGVANTTVEAGSTYSPNINLYGNKNDAGLYTQLRILRDGSPILTDTTLTQSSITDIPPQFGYTDPNNPNYRYTINPTPYNESYVIPSGVTSTTTYYGDGNYNSGLAKQDNKGDYDTRTPALRSTSAPQSSGSNFATTTYTITGIFPYFYGTSLTLPTQTTIANAISGGTATLVLSSASGTLSIPYNNPSTWLYIWFAYPSSYTTKTKWYVTPLDNGDIDGSFITTAVTQVADSSNGYWENINFKMHWSVYPTQQNTIEFRNN